MHDLSVTKINKDARISLLLSLSPLAKCWDFVLNRKHNIVKFGGNYGLPFPLPPPAPSAPAHTHGILVKPIYWELFSFPLKSPTKSLCVWVL